jgi:hypothetical protein
LDGFWGRIGVGVGGRIEVSVGVGLGEGGGVGGFGEGRVVLCGPQWTMMASSCTECCNVSSPST